MEIIFICPVYCLNLTEKGKPKRSMKGLIWDLGPVTICIVSYLNKLYLNELMSQNFKFKHDMLEYFQIQTRHI